MTHAQVSRIVISYLISSSLLLSINQCAVEMAAVYPVVSA